MDNQGTGIMATAPDMLRDLARVRAVDVARELRLHSFSVAVPTPIELMREAAALLETLAGQS
jgi:hypothetical protein